MERDQYRNQKTTGERIKFLVLFNHTLTPVQQKDASDSLGIDQILYPPHSLRELWANFPPEPVVLAQYLAPFFAWLEENSTAGDYLLVQGDFGACFLIVQYAFSVGLVPVYSTTQRQAVEELIGDNEVRLYHRVQHVRFRRYERRVL